MKRVELPHLYKGQVLSHSFMFILPSDGIQYPVDHGYEFHIGGKFLGECKVVERRTIKVGSITESMAHIICGLSTHALMEDLQRRGMSTEPDASMFLFCFQYLRYYETHRAKVREISEMTMATAHAGSLNYAIKF